MAVQQFTANPQGGEQAITGVTTTWQGVRLLNPRIRRVTITSPAGSDHYFGRGQTDGGAVTAGSHSANVGGSPFSVFLGPWTPDELSQGYRDVYIALASGGPVTVHVRAEVA